MLERRWWPPTHQRLIMLTLWSISSWQVLPVFIPYVARTLTNLAYAFRHSQTPTILI